MKKLKHPKQQLVIPKGSLAPGEAAVIEIPRRYHRAPVVILKRRTGELASARAEGHFIPAPNDLVYVDVPSTSTGPNVSITTPAPQLQPMQGNIPTPVVPYPAPPPQGVPGNVWIPPQMHQPPPQMGQITPENVWAPPPTQQVPLSVIQVTPGNVWSPQQMQQIPSTVRQQASVVYPPHQPSLQMPAQYMPNETYVVLPQDYSQSMHQPSCCKSPSTLNPQWPGQINLLKKEKREQEIFNRSLEEFQKARRRFLANTTALSRKSSNESSSSSDT